MEYGRYYKIVKYIIVKFYVNHNINYVFIINTLINALTIIWRDVYLDNMMFER